MKKRGRNFLSWNSRAGALKKGVRNLFSSHNGAGRPRGFGGKKVPDPFFRGFVLLEVLISLVILGITVATILRSFTLSMEAARRSEVINTGVMLAQTLIEEAQISPPAPGRYEGNFGEENPDYFYELEVEDEEQRYSNDSRARRSDDKFYPMRMMRLEVTYDDGKRRTRVVSTPSAVLGFNKFHDGAIQYYQLFDQF